MSVIKFSDIFTLTARNWIQSAILSAMTAFSTALLNSLGEDQLFSMDNLKKALIAGGITGLVYLLKKFTEPSPQAVVVDTSKTMVIEKHTKEVIANNTPNKDLIL